MIRTTPKSLVGLTLSFVVGATSTLPAYSQQTTNEPRGQLSPTEELFNETPTPGGTVPDSTLPAGADVGESYTLGPGDIVRVDIFDITPELPLEQRYTILVDGTLNLPWVGSVPIAGLTLRQAGDLLAQRYGRFIRNPVVTISLLAPRPLKIGVIGEVNRPGSYLISVISNEVTQTSLNQRTASEGGNQFPRVSQALQTAGGITQLANIRDVQIRRPRIDGGEEIIAINLWKFLSEGDLRQDILLRDGDTLVVPKATVLDSEEARQVAVSNFSPATINVNIVGEVANPGTLQVRPDTTLNQAIMASGGFVGGRASRKGVDLIRLNPNGTITRRKISIDLDQNMNEERNPRLHNNDIVVVNRTFIAKVNDFLTNAIGVPLTIFGGISGFRNLVKPNL